MKYFDFMGWIRTADAGDKLKIKMLESSDSQTAEGDDWGYLAPAVRIFKLSLNGKVVIGKMTCYDSWGEFGGELEYEEIEDGQITE